MRRGVFGNGYQGASVGSACRNRVQRGCATNGNGRTNSRRKNIGGIFWRNTNTYGTLTMPTKHRTKHDLQRVKKALTRRLARVTELKQQLSHLHGVHPHLVEVARQRNEAETKMKDAVDRAHESHDLLNKSRVIGARYERKSKLLAGVSVALVVVSVALAIYKAYWLFR